MPRKARIDAPGALHHVMGRGIEGRDIFEDIADREDFLDRLGTILSESHTRCYAWSILPNHFHLLIETMQTPLANVMRKLMTGYAVSYNRRHQRNGHLFQNRYKSIVCDKRTYLLELVRYIHLNPLRAGLVDDLSALDVYPYTGHSALLGTSNYPWQNCSDILALFDQGITYSRRLYRLYVKKGIAQGHRPDLTGGGLLRSTGGWSTVKRMRKKGVSYQSDERILGDTAFVSSVLSKVEDTKNSRFALLEKGVTFDQLLKTVAAYMKILPEDILGPGKNRHKVRARSLLCYWATRELGETMTSLADRMGMSVANVSISVQRGEGIIRENFMDINGLLNL